MSEVRSTPLRQEHERLGAKMVEFAGWCMPVEYRGLRQEHLNTRENGGLFDVSHMGEIRFQGDQALAALQWLTSNDVGKLSKGQAQYSLLTNFAGGIVDDIIIYCLEKGTDYLVCVNAANTEKDWQWMVKNNKGAKLTNESSHWGQIAVQGPKAKFLVAKIFGDEVLTIPTFGFSLVPFEGAECLLARTGYTGEDGFEVFVPAASTAALWRQLVQFGSEMKIEPVGLGARDTLRTEMKYSLYGHEIDDATNPYEAGLGWVVKPEAKDFIGKGKILQGKQQGLRRKLIGFIMTERGIPRQGYPLFSFDNREIGRVTSGTVSPSLNDNIGVGYVEAEFGEIGAKICVDIRGRKVQARVTKTPFVSKKE